MANARKTAEQKIEEVKQLKKEAEKIMEQYVDIYVQIEDRLQFLRQYRNRGIITDEEFPKLERKKLIDEYFTAYRDDKRKIRQGITEALKKYPPELLIIMQNEDGSFDLMYISSNNSFCIEENIADGKRKSMVIEYCNRYNIGYQM